MMDRMTDHSHQQPQSVGDEPNTAQGTDACPHRRVSASGLGDCPLCDDPLAANWSGPLYGVMVCESCRRSLCRARHLAFFIDGLTLFAAAGAWVWARSLLSISSSFDSGVIVGLVCLFLLKDSSPTIFPGRSLTGLEVVDRLTRRRASRVQTFARNLPWLCWPIGFVMLAQLKKGHRLGDRLLGTMVIQKKLRNREPYRGLSRVCLSCGYDLTGNVTGRCPECGETTIPE